MIKVYLTDWQAQLTVQALEGAINDNYSMRDPANACYQRIIDKINKQR